MFICKVSKSNKPSSSGDFPLVLQNIGGLSPRAVNFVPSIVAENSGFKEGDLCLASFIERENKGPNGERNFNFTNLGALTPMDLVALKKDADYKNQKFLIQPSVSDEVTRQENLDSLPFDLAPAGTPATTMS